MDRAMNLRSGMPVEVTRHAGGGVQQEI